MIADLLSNFRAVSRAKRCRVAGGNVAYNPSDGRRCCMCFELPWLSLLMLPE